jgi:hypothetical protein
MNLRTTAATAVLTAAVSLPCATAAQAQPGGRDKDCSDFDTQLDAQRVRDGDPLDFFRLDSDEDGIACEGLPGTPVGADRTPTGAATPNAPSTAAPPDTELTPVTGTRQPSGAPQAGVGDTAAGPADVLLPLGMALTALAVGGGVVVLIARRRAHTTDD